MLKNTNIPVQTTIQSHGRLLDLSTPIVMGILNATPDSFYNKGRDSDREGLTENADKMVAEGAAILDIGGASTRPGQPPMSGHEELQRVLPVLEVIRERHPHTWISVDTYNAATAARCIEAGADIINDISGGLFDKDMLPTISKYKVPFIVMHIQGTPETMQQNPTYNDVVTEVRTHLIHAYQRCVAAGIRDVIIDPGFGFGKTVAHNFQLLHHLHTFRMLGRPVLAGLSRKSMICKTLSVSPEHALNGTTALHMIALRQGASILRVHDVREAVEVVRLSKE
jgi:dihydropteroate synthase